MKTMSLLALLALLAWQLPPNTFGATETEEAPATEVETEPSESAADGEPDIFCEKPEFDFGEAKIADIVEHTFVVKNNGDGVLEVTEARPTCGCTVVDFKGATAQPGEEIEIPIKLDLKARRGPQHKTVRVFSNDPDTPEMHLKIKGNSTTDIQISVDRFHFNQIAENAEETITADITIAEGVTAHVLDASSNVEEFKVELETVETGKTYKVHVSTIPPIEKKSVMGAVRILTDLPGEDQIPISATASIMQILTLNTEQVMVFPQSDGRFRVQDVWIKQGKVTEFTVKDAVIVDSDIEPSVIPFPDGRVRIVIPVLDDKESLRDKKLVVTTSAEGMETIEFQFKLPK